MVYIDDVFVIRGGEKEKLMLKEWLAREFKIQNLDKLKYFLGIEVVCSKLEIFFF